jgi:hypothetical protein
MNGGYIGLPMTTADPATAVEMDSRIATDSRVTAMRDAFSAWYGQNAHAIEDGGTGDVEALYQALWAASQ